jgi:hypothetical protein
LFVGALTAFALSRPRALAPISCGLAAVGAPCLLVIQALEGPLYWREGLRFSVGHAELWGNTAFAAAAADRFGALVALPGVWTSLALAVAGGALGLGRRRDAPQICALAGAWAVYLLWATVFQNPDHLRHLSPIMLIGGLLLILAPRAPRGRAAVTIAAFAANMLACLSSLDISPHAAPPLQAAIARLAQAPRHSAVALNEGVETVRAALPRLEVYDMFYAADARFGLEHAAGKAFRLSTSPIAGACPAATFPGRVLGEQTLYLYQIRSAGQL